jgi:hypothetical protein
MALTESTGLADETETGRKAQPVTSLQDLTIINAWDSETNTAKYMTFCLVTHDEEVYFGQS